MNITLDNKPDPWNHGSYNKNVLWSLYTVLNYVGSIQCWFCTYRLSRIARKYRTSGDVFMMCYFHGCWMMGLFCASQCLADLIAGRFVGGEVACQIEAFSHVSSILVQFFAVTLIAGRNYFVVRSNYGCDYPIRRAILIWIVVYLFGCAGTYATGLVSKIVLMPAGAYCFFDFVTPTIVWWFVPVMLCSLTAATYFYIQIFRLTRASELVVGQRFGKAQQRVARRSILFLGVYFVGWFPAVIACCFALIRGYLLEEMDIALAICGSLHTIWVPSAYQYTNRKLRPSLPCCSGSHTIVPLDGTGQAQIYRLSLPRINTIPIHARHYPAASPQQSPRNPPSPLLSGTRHSTPGLIQTS